MTLSSSLQGDFEIKKRSDTTGGNLAVEADVDVTGAMEVTGTLEVGGVAFTDKADKVIDGVTGNLAGLDADGNPTDSGVAVQTTLSDSDAHVPTSGAVADYVAAVAEPVWTTHTISDTSPTIALAARNRYCCGELSALTVTTTGLDGEATLLFSSGTTATTFQTTFGDTAAGITMTGDHCSAGVFTPLSDTQYILRFFGDGEHVYGLCAAANESTELVPILIVTTKVGAELTCTNGDIVLNGVSETGVCAFLLPCTGDWTVSGIYDDVPGDSVVTVHVTGVKTWTAEITFAGVAVYGVRHYKTLPSTVLERLGDSVGKTFTPQIVEEDDAGGLTTTQPGASGFDTAEIYKDIKVCNVRDGVIVYNEGEEGFSYSCKHGVQVVIAESDSVLSVNTWYNGARVNTQTPTSPTGADLVDVTCGTHTLTWNTTRTTDLTPGTYNLSGGDADHCGSVVCGSEDLCTAGGTGDWSNYLDTGDCMVKIPKYYLKIIDNDTTTTIWMSNRKGSGFVTSPAHSDRGDGYGERNTILLGRYHASTGYRSASGRTTLVRKNLAEYRTGHINRGSGYFNFDFAAYCTCVWLFLVETADLNSQGSIGLGFNRINNNNDNASAGSTDRLGWHSGYVLPYGATDSSQCSIVWRGIENFWGSYFTFLDGLKASSGEFYQTLNPTQFNSEESIAGYERWPVTTHYTGGYIKSMHIDSQNARITASGTTDASDHTYWCDFGYRLPGTGFRFPLYGLGTSIDNKSIGLFSFYFYTVDQYSTFTSARLMILP